MPQWPLENDHKWLSQSSVLNLYKSSFWPKYSEINLGIIWNQEFDLK